MSLEQVNRALNVAGELSPTVRHVLLVLATYADQDGRRAFPSVSTLGRQTGLDVRTVQRALGALRAAGLVTISEPAVGRLPTCYQITLPETPTPGTVPPRQSVTPGTPPPVTPGIWSPTPGNGSIDPRHTATQSLRDLPVNQNAGARAREERGARSGAERDRTPITPPSNLHDSSPRFPLPTSPKNAPPVAPGNGLDKPQLDDATRAEIRERRRREAAAIAAELAGKAGSGA